MKIVGMMRIRNEARWIARCVESILPICEQVFVLDDHSDDGTPFICSSIPRVNVFDSPFSGVNEVRDKQYLLDKIEAGGRPDWIVHIDGDEMLPPGDVDNLRATMADGRHKSLSFRILYLWDREDQIRTDGIYGRFRRQSAFRPDGSKFEGVGAGGNFHCSNVPGPLRHMAHPANVSLLHFGYMHREDRIRKHSWYNELDKNNIAEDRYRHVVQGDVPEIPASAKLLHAGPLALQPFVQTTHA